MEEFTSIVTANGNFSVKHSNFSFLIFLPVHCVSNIPATTFVFLFTHLIVVYLNLFVISVVNLLRIARKNLDNTVYA